MTFFRKALRRIFPPRAVRIPGKFPWVQPKPLPFGTILIDVSPGSAFRCIADGKGGITTQYVGPKPRRASRSRTG